VHLREWIRSRFADRDAQSGIRAQWLDTEDALPFLVHVHIAERSRRPQVSHVTKPSTVASCSRPDVSERHRSRRRAYCSGCRAQGRSSSSIARVRRPSRTPARQPARGQLVYETTEVTIGFGAARLSRNPCRRSIALGLRWAQSRGATCASCSRHVRFGGHQSTDGWTGYTIQQVENRKESSCRALARKAVRVDFLRWTEAQEASGS